MEELVGARSENVQVAVRVRPLNAREITRETSSMVSWRMESNTVYQVVKGSTNSAASFSFDHLFTEKATNKHVFEAIASPIVKSVVDGYSGIIFAYGQTSSGKTHTMLGNDSDLGVTRRSVQAMIQYATKQQDRVFHMAGTYVEIYNENIRDLLNPGAENLKIREHPLTGQVYVDSRSQVITCVDDVMKMIVDGERYRSVGETNMNERSSRSHTIFTINLVSQKKTAKEEGEGSVVRHSSISLVDLAGSERAKQSGAEGKRLLEGGHINKSLLTLGKVISKLSASSNGAGSSHIPYRDSKLTRLLQPALGGNARTAIICAITPAGLHVEETLSTLKFASGAKKVRNRATCVVLMDDTAKLRLAEKEIEKLKRELRKHSRNSEPSNHDRGSEEQFGRYNIENEESGGEHRMDTNNGKDSGTEEHSKLSDDTRLSSEITITNDAHENGGFSPRLSSVNSFSMVNSLRKENEELERSLRSTEAALTAERRKNANLLRHQAEADVSNFVHELIDDVLSSCPPANDNSETAGKHSSAKGNTDSYKKSKTSPLDKKYLGKISMEKAALCLVIQNRVQKLESAMSDLQLLKEETKECHQNFCNSRILQKCISPLEEKESQGRMSSVITSPDRSEESDVAVEVPKEDYMKNLHNTPKENNSPSSAMLRFEICCTKECRDDLMEKLIIFLNECDEIEFYDVQEKSKSPSKREKSPEAIMQSYDDSEEENNIVHLEVQVSHKARAQYDLVQKVILFLQTHHAVNSYCIQQTPGNLSECENSPNKLHLPHGSGELVSLKLDKQALEEELATLREQVALLQKAGERQGIRRQRALDSGEKDVASLSASDATKQSAEERNQFQEIIERLREEMRSEQKAKSEISAKLVTADEHARAQKEELERKTKEWEKHLRLAEQQRDKLQAEMERLKDKANAVDTLTRKLDKLTHEHTSTVEQLQETNGKLTMGSHGFQSLQLEKIALTDKVEALQEELQSHRVMEADTAEIVKAKREKEEELEELSALLTAEQEKNVDLCKRIEELTLQDNENAALVAREKAELVDELSNLKKKYSKTVQDMQKMKTEESNNHNSMRELKGKQEKFQKLLAKHLREAEASARERVKLLQTIDSRDQRVFELREKLEDYRRGNGAIKRLEGEVSKRDRELQQLRRRLQQEEEILVSEGLGQQCLNIEKIVRIEAERDNITADLERQIKERKNLEQEREAMKLENIKLREVIKRKDISRLKLIADLKKSQASLYEATKNNKNQAALIAAPLEVPLQKTCNLAALVPDFLEEDKENIIDPA